MNFLTFFKTNTDPRRRGNKRVNILDLEKDAICYYGEEKTPFRVVERGMTNRGVFFVEIRSLKSGKAHLFIDQYYVSVDEPTLNPN